MIRAILLALAVSPALPAQTSDWALFRGLHASGALELHVADPDLAGELRRRLEPYAGALPLATTVVEPGDDGDDRAPRIVLARSGSAGAQRAFELLGDLDAVPEEGGFRLLGLRFGPDTTAGPALFAVTREDPERPGRPLTVVVGTRDANVAAVLDLDRPWWRPALRVWSRGRSLELSTAATAAELAPGSSAWRPRAEGWRRRAAPDALFSVNVAAALEDATAEEYLRSAERASRRVLRWFGATAPVRPPEVWLVARADETGEAPHGLSRPSDTDDGAVALVAPGLAHDGGAALACSLALAAGGEPRELWMRDAVGVAAAGTWWGRPLEEWVGHLAHAGLGLPLEELVDPGASARHSVHRLTPLRAWLLTRLAAGEARGLAARWRDGLAAQERSALGGRLAGWLAEADEAYVSRAPRPSIASPARGVALAAADRADALGRARELGADAASLSVLVPLAGPPRGAPRRIASGASATDAVLSQALAHARGLGMSRLLVLEPLAAPTGIRADRASRTLPEDWEAFFDAYEACALHYALLAELLDLETFCFGTDLTSALDIRSVAGNSRKREIKRERMLGLLGTLRAAYPGGRLTYAAATVSHLKTVHFADRLDLLSVYFFPAHPADETDPGPPDRGVLQGRMRYQLSLLRDVAHELEKPALLIQTGFPSSERAWEDPRLPRPRVDQEAQRMLYEELARALQHDAWGQEWFAGLYLWCVRDGASDDAPGWGHGFTGKPAEALVPAILDR